MIKYLFFHIFYFLKSYENFKDSLKMKNVTKIIIKVKDINYFQMLF
jgi:hypothetical protein